MSAGGPFLTVLVPVYNGHAVLPRSLAALAASDLPRDQWELIVVDDCSRDDTAEIAAPYADSVVTLEGGPYGPGYARNRGVEVATGAVVVFVDADVCVHSDTLTLFAEHFQSADDLSAVFGAYDDQPDANGFLSVYRNLLHRYVHERDAGEAETFWAGCGAVKASEYREVGGFDEDRFPRPQIEDIELGYRLRDRGGRILIDPAVQAKHLKRWTFFGMVRTDLLDRGIPWMRLLLERGPQTKASLNVGAAEKIKTLMVGSGLAALVLGALLPSGFAATLGLVLLAAVTLSNLALYRWFAEKRGLFFALGVVPLQILYYVLNGIAAGTGMLLHATARPTAKRVTAARP